MSTIDTGSVPRRGWHVRRRKYNGAVTLVSRNRFFELDATADVVWLAIDGVQPLADIARHIAATHHRPLGEALAAVLLAADCFEREGLLEYAPGREPGG